MLTYVMLEQRNYEMTIEHWRAVDAQGAWRISSDVSYTYDKQKHERIWYLRTSAASAFITWLRARGQVNAAAEVQWRWQHQAPVPMLKPSPTAAVRPLPGQLELFDGA